MLGPRAAPESGAGDEVIMSIAGHVSRAMPSRYSHVRMEAKRRALDEIAARQRVADAKRQQETERQQQTLIEDECAAIQQSRPSTVFTNDGHVAFRAHPT
jgi:hypothetical protein